MKRYSRVRRGGKPRKSLKFASIFPSFFFLLYAKQKKCCLPFDEDDPFFDELQHEIDGREEEEEFEEKSPLAPMSRSSNKKPKPKAKKGPSTRKIVPVSLKSRVVSMSADDDMGTQINFKESPRKKHLKRQDTGALGGGHVVKLPGKVPIPSGNTTKLKSGKTSVQGASRVVLPGMKKGKKGGKKKGKKKGKAKKQKSRYAGGKKTNDCIVM